MEQQRVESWIDSLPIDDQSRAHLLAGLPAPMAVARVDRDLRIAMHEIEDRLVAEIRKAPERDVISKKTVAMLAILGGAVVDAALSAFHSVR